MVTLSKMHCHTYTTTTTTIAIPTTDVSAIKRLKVLPRQQTTLLSLQHNYNIINEEIYDKAHRKVRIWKSYSCVTQ